MWIGVSKKHSIKTWYYDFTLKGKRYRGWLEPASTMSKRQANAAVEKIKAKVILKGNYSPVPRKVNSKEVFASHKLYLQTYKPETYDRINYMFKRISFFHGKTITDKEILKYQKLRLSQGVSKATVNRELELARTAFNRAIKKRRITENPFLHFDKFPEIERTRYLTKDEISRLLKAASELTNEASPHLYGIIVTAIHTGMRLGEILHLHRKQIDFNQRFLMIAATGTKKYRDPKIVPMEPFLCDIFRKKLEHSKSGYVFENPSLHKPYNNIRRAFLSTLKRAGINDFRFHDLRHTFATYALLASRDLRCVQELLGHTDVRTTQRYAHVLGAQKTKVISKTSQLLSANLDKNLDKF